MYVTCNIDVIRLCPHPREAVSKQQVIPDGPQSMTALLNFLQLNCVRLQALQKLMYDSVFMGTTQSLASFCSRRKNFAAS